jgi:hypothetical protein
VGLNTPASEFDVLYEEIVCGDEQASVEQEGDVEVVDPNPWYLC